MAFEMDFASEIPLSAIKSMICRRFSLFRFRFSVFKVVLSDSSSFIEGYPLEYRVSSIFSLPVFLIPVVWLFRNSHFQNAHINKRLDVPFAIDRLIGQSQSGQ